MNGNTSDRTTLRQFPDAHGNTYGKAKRVWVMDRGIPTEEILAEMRVPERQMFYLVGTPKSKINQYEKQWLDLPWQKVRDSVEVKLYTHDERTLCAWPRATGRQQKEIAMRRKRLVASVAETACDAAQLAFTRSIAHAYRSGQDRSGPRVWFRQDSTARARTARHARIVSFPARQGQA